MVKFWLKNTLPLGMNILEPDNPHKSKKQFASYTYINTITLNLKKS